MRDTRRRDEYRELVCTQPPYKHGQISLFRSACSGDAGEGRKFHFNSTTGICQEISYRGCFGSDNLFDDLDTCQDICLPKEEEGGGGKEGIPFGIDPRLKGTNDDSSCGLPPYVDSPVQKACRARKPRWSFQEGKCKQIFYNGCGATENLYENEEQCLDKCDKRAKGWEKAGRIFPRIRKSN